MNVVIGLCQCTKPVRWRKILVEVERYVALVVVPCSLIVVLTGCVSDQEFTQLKASVERQKSVLQQSEQLPEMVQKLDIRTDAYAAKVREVVNTLNDLDLAVSTKIDEQDKRIERGREAYLNVLTTQQKTIETWLSEIRSAIEKLSEPVPEAKEVLPAPLSPTAPGE